MSGMPFKNRAQLPSGYKREEKRGEGTDGGIKQKDSLCLRFHDGSADADQLDVKGEIFAGQRVIAVHGDGVGLRWR